MSLAERLITLSSDLAKNEEGWVQFIKDHFAYIRDNSPSVTITLGAMHRYRYRPEDFMREFGYDPNLTWIMLLINEIKTRVDFEGLSEVKVPSLDLITTLRGQYDTYKVVTEASEVELLG